VLDGEGVRRGVDGASQREEREEGSHGCRPERITDAKMFNARA
jgi:hypothetical protein